MASAAEAAPKLSATERIRQKRLQKQGQAEGDGASTSQIPDETMDAAGAPVAEVASSSEVDGATPAEAENAIPHGDAGNEADGYQAEYDATYYDENYYATEGAYDYAEQPEGSPTSPDLDLAAAAAQDEAFLEQMALSKQRLEEEVAAKKELLSKTIQERFDQAVRETEILNMVRQELGKLDQVAQTDIDLLRIKIDETVKQLANARTRYERAESQFMNAKMDLQIKKNDKTLLTEHFTLLIQQNEQRKAEKLEELMGRLAIKNQTVAGDLKIAMELPAAAMTTASNAPTEVSLPMSTPAHSVAPTTNAPPEASAAEVNLATPSSSAPSTVDAPTTPQTVSPTVAVSASSTLSEPNSGSIPKSPASLPPAAGTALGNGKGKGKGPPPPGWRGPPGKGAPGKGKGMPTPGKPGAAPRGPSPKPSPTGAPPPGSPVPASATTQARGPPASPVK